MAENRRVMGTGSEAMEGSATVEQGLPDDDGAGNFRAASPTLENVQSTSLLPPTENHGENSAAEGSGADARPSDELPHSDDSSGCSTPTDDPQMPGGMLEMSHKQMMSFIRSRPETDKETGIILYQGVYQNQMVIIKEHPEKQMRQFLKVREMAYLRNTFILPVLGYTMSSRMIMYPQMVQGDLSKVCTKLNWSERLRILYQVCSGTAFLHSSKPGIREEIWHGSIKAVNIYVDQNLNVRIGDFSEAIELRKKSASPSDVAKDDPITMKDLKDDICGISTVGRLLMKSSDVSYNLSWLPDAKKIVSREKYWDMEIWKHAPKQVREKMAELIVHCSRKRITAECLEINLKRLLQSLHIPLYNKVEECSNYCIHCCVNNTQDDDLVPVLTSELCPDACPSRRFCRTCYQTSYRNLLFCPDHGPLKDKIHQRDVYAILVSGFGKTSEEQNIFDGDVESMFNVITDPRILGLSATNVIRISHNSADKRQEIYVTLKNLKTMKVHTLIFFYSGHGTKAEGDDKDSDVDDVPRLKFGNSTDTSMTDKDLCKLLTPFTKTNLFVIMDCCYAARYHILPQLKDPHPNIWHVQFNGTGSSNLGLMDLKINVSDFTCCLVRAMEGGFSCPRGVCDASKCEARVKLQRSATATGFISLYNSHEYITAHTKDDNVDSNLFTYGLSDDLLIACYSGTPLGIFKYDIGGKRRRLMNVMMSQLQDNPDDMLRQLWDDMGTVIGKTSRRRQLPKNLDFRCLIITVPKINAEQEIKTKFEVVRQCSRGHTVQIGIRSRCQDLDLDRCVVCFFPDHTHFKAVLDMVGTSFKDFFWEKFDVPDGDDPKGQEILQAAVINIRIAEDPDFPKLQSVYYSYEMKKYLDLIVTSLTQACKMARSNLDILGLRVHITSNLASLELEMKKSLYG